MLALRPDIVEAVWQAVAGHLPEREEKPHPLGCHRGRVPDRDCFEAILFRLVTGCSWDVAGRLGKGGETTLRRRRTVTSVVTIVSSESATLADVAEVGIDSGRDHVRDLNDKLRTNGRAAGVAWGEAFRRVIRRLCKQKTGTVEQCLPQTPATERSGVTMRVSRGTAMILVLIVVGSCSACATTSVHPSTTTGVVTTTTGPSTTAPRSDVPYGPGGTWRLVFSDDFTGSSLNTDNWSTCYHFGCTNGGNKELEWYQASQVRVHDGTASLTVVPRETNGKKYVSGMLSSYRKFSFRYGYAQIVAKLPIGRGLWSAFWMEPEDGSWPPEIDIMENLAQSDSVSLYVHYDSANHFDSSIVYLPTASRTFHTYGVDWEPKSIAWYVDGFLWARFTVSITQPEYLIVDLAVNGKFAPNSADRFPQNLLIRSIKVWQRPSPVLAQAGR